MSWGTCAKKTAGTSRYTGIRTCRVCWCCVCTKFEGKANALHLCSRCQKIDTAHMETARVAAAKEKYAPISWAEVPPVYLITLMSGVFRLVQMEMVASSRQRSGG